LHQFGDDAAFAVPFNEFAEPVSIHIEPLISHRFSPKTNGAFCREVGKKPHTAVVNIRLTHFLFGEGDDPAETKYAAGDKDTRAFQDVRRHALKPKLRLVDARSQIEPGLDQPLMNAVSLTRAWLQFLLGYREITALGDQMLDQIRSETRSGDRKSYPDEAAEKLRDARAKLQRSRGFILPSLESDQPSRSS